MPAVSLQPAAGAQGELTALLVAAAYFRDRGERRTKVLVPDSAHGTNPASAAMAGFDAVTVKSNADGLRRSGRPRGEARRQTAVFMITNPNTLGLFERQIATIAELVHGAGGLDLSRRREHERHPRHHAAGRLRRRHDALQPAQDLQRPARRRRPRRGADRRPRKCLGRICRRRWSSATASDYRLDYDRPKSIGRVRSFFGNVGVLVRAYCYIRTHGPDGLAKRVARTRCSMPTTCSAA